MKRVPPGTRPGTRAGPGDGARQGVVWEPSRRGRGDITGSCRGTAVPCPRAEGGQPCKLSWGQGGRGAGLGLDPASSSGAGVRQQGTCSETGPRVTMPRSENLREGSRGWGRSSACSVKKDEARRISSSHSSDVSTLLTLSPGRGYAYLPIHPWRHSSPFVIRKPLSSEDVPVLFPL